MQTIENDLNKSLKNTAEISRFEIISKFATELANNQKPPNIEFEMTFKKNINNLFSRGEMDI